MSLVTTSAVVLHSFKYKESSKIVRLATRELGVQSAIAKGALKPKSKFGARLQLLSEGVAQLYVKQGRELHTLAAFDVTRQWQELAHDLRRYAASTALAELILRCVPAGPSVGIYDHLVTALDRIAAAPTSLVESTGLSALWGVVCALGFAPALDGCARDGRRLPEGAASFSIADGGFLCAACAEGASGTTLEAGDRATLERLIVGNGDGGDAIPPRHAAAHRRLLGNFVRWHLGEDRELKALTFWETRPWTGTS